MPEQNRIVDFPDSSCAIAFVYKEIGADRDIPYVYWDNQKWIQLLYDAFRESWFSSQPILYGGHEAITTHFDIEPFALSVDDIACSSPEKLLSPGNSKPPANVIYLKNVTRYSHWRDINTNNEFLAERFSSGDWCLASLDREADKWNIEGSSLSDSEICLRYSAHYPKINLLGGIPPDA